jgi:serine/threonine-protein kinase HipA
VYPKQTSTLSDQHCGLGAILFTLASRLSWTREHVRVYAVTVEGWRLSPAYDLNPVPVDIRPRVLATAVDPDDSTASLELALQVAAYFELRENDARKIAGEVGHAVSAWRREAKKPGLAAPEIERTASAFEHDDLKEAPGFFRRSGSSRR